MHRKRTQLQLSRPLTPRSRGELQTKGDANAAIEQLQSWEPHQIAALLKYYDDYAAPRGSQPSRRTRGDHHEQIETAIRWTITEAIGWLQGRRSLGPSKAPQPDVRQRVETLAAEVADTRSQVEEIREQRGTQAAEPDRTQDQYKPKRDSDEYTVLDVLWEEQAFSATASVTAAEISKKAHKRDPVKYKRPVTRLRKLGLVDTASGRHGGCWLTRKGQQLCDNLFGSAQS